MKLLTTALTINSGIFKEWQIPEVFTSLASIKNIHSGIKINAFLSLHIEFSQKNSIL
jgi:hypothetical protein